MKRLAWFGIVFMICMGLTSCAYRAVNGVRIQGKNVDASFSQLTQSFHFKGEQVQATLIRQSTLAGDKTAQKKPEIYGLPNLKEKQLYFELNQSVDGGSKK